MYLVNGTLSNTLPFRLHLPDGRTRTSLHEMSEAQLAELAIYPVDDIKPPITWTQHYGTPEITVTDGRATATYPVVDYSPEEVAGILEAAKAAKRAEIAAARWAEMSTPTAVDGYEAVWYADKESMNDMLRASSDLQTAIALGHLPEGSAVQWKTAEGTFVTLGLNDLITIRLLLSQRQQALYAREADWVRQIKDVESPEDLEVIVW
jgi:hypothetical protein